MPCGSWIPWSFCLLLNSISYFHIIYYPWFPSHNTCSLLVRYPKCCFLSRVQGQNLSFCFISPLHLFLLVSQVCCSWSTFVLPCLVLEISLRNPKKVWSHVYSFWTLSTVLLGNIRTKPNISVFLLGKNMAFVAWIPTFPIELRSFAWWNRREALDQGLLRLELQCSRAEPPQVPGCENAGELGRNRWGNAEKYEEIHGTWWKKRWTSWRIIDICLKIIEHIRQDDW